MTPAELQLARWALASALIAGLALGWTVRGALEQPRLVERQPVMIARIA